MMNWPNYRLDFISVNAIIDMRSTNVRFTDVNFSKYVNSIQLLKDAYINYKQ